MNLEQRRLLSPKPFMIFIDYLAICRFLKERTEKTKSTKDPMFIEIDSPLGKIKSAYARVFRRCLKEIFPKAELKKKNGRMVYDIYLDSQEARDLNELIPSASSEELDRLLERKIFNKSLRKKIKTFVSAKTACFIRPSNQYFSRNYIVVSIPNNVRGYKESPGIAVLKELVLYSEILDEFAEAQRDYIVKSETPKVLGFNAGSISIYPTSVELISSDDIYSFSEQVEDPLSANTEITSVASTNNYTAGYPRLRSSQPSSNSLNRFMSLPLEERQRIFDNLANRED